MRIKKKDGTIQPFITGKDVVITKESLNENKEVTVDDVLDEHKKEIDKLKSNVKYIYAYGGVGGNGHGGSGGGSTGNPTLFVSLGGHQIQSGSDNIIIFGKPGEYVFEGSLSNAGGEIFYVYVGYGKNIKNPKQITLDKENRWIIKSETYNLKENGQITVTLKDVEGRTLSTVTQTYVVNAHSFDAKFKYVFEDREIEFSPYEYFMGNYNQRNPFIDITFSINIPNVQNVIVSYNIKGVDGESDIQYSDSMGDITTGKGTVSYGQITNSNLRIYLDNLKRNDIPFIHENNTGSYDVTITLNYSVSGSPADPTQVTFKITLIPNLLYINVRNSHNILYDSLEELKDDLSQLVEDQDFAKGIPVGSNTSFYCKVYEQAISSNKKIYNITFNAYDENKSSEETEDDFEDDPHYTIYKTAEEQVETPQPINISFDSTGIKKLQFITTGKKDTSAVCTITKYIYVKPNKNKIDWYPSCLVGINQDSYFRANQGEDTYKDFPELPVSNNLPLVMSETSTPLSLTHTTWSHPTQGFDTTILSFGIQYGAVNNEHAEVIKLYNNNDLIINLRSDTLFSEDSKKILLPLERDLNSSDSSKYHLVQIVRYRIGTDTGETGTGGYLYGTYLYIDGRLESDDPSGTLTNSLYIDKIVLNNVNAIYNLISVQYLKLDEPLNVKNISHTGENNTIDGIIYQYYLAYKSIMNVGEVTDSELKLLDNISEIKFDGTNVVVDYNYLTNVSQFMPIPTMMMSYGNKDDTGGNTISEQEVRDFCNKLFRGYQSGNTNIFGDQEISLYWCEGIKNGTSSSTISKINIPTFNDDGYVYDGTWHVKLQGTSTMKNRIKNFSLYIKKRNSDLQKSILVSPNYNSEDEHSFLPENEWTLKADIADSAHANNTAVGKFVNYTSTPFSNNLPLPTNVRRFVKNTLEGFPVLMYFRVGDEIYYLGVYNFNMGRQSYYNLGYHSADDMLDMINHIPEHSSSSFTFSLGNGTPVDNLMIAEIQENWPDFDFHQYDDSVLFQDSGTPRTMFGNPEEKMTYTNIDNAKRTLREFVKSVAKAGAYCFANIGKIPVSSYGEGGYCLNKYNATDNPDGTITETVPDLSYQFYYDQNNKRVYREQDPQTTFDVIKRDRNNLLKCIYTLEDDDVTENHPYLNFTSVSEYYTICMACGLIDSILKNMNIKSWDGTTCFTAFYDMDCAFGEDNIGRENVSYLAATDYWYSPVSDAGYVEPIKKKFDYWDQNVGKGYDFTSSYLFAIAKYAQVILNVEKPDLVLFNYPQQFWAKLRNGETGELRNADYFMKNYFSSGVTVIPSYLASLNYQVKYLYYGSVIDETGRETESRYLANESAFNGTRYEKVREWLNRRLHFLDFMFNVQGIEIPIGTTSYKIPTATIDVIGDLNQNNDIVILKDAFSTDMYNGAIIGSDGDFIGIEAPLNTPIVVLRGKSKDMYLFTAGINRQNNFRVIATPSETYRILGSTEFVNMTYVEPVLTEAYKIESDNLREIIYGGRTIQVEHKLDIISSSVKNIKLNIPTWSGQLVISTGTRYGQALQRLDISDSGFFGIWTDLKNLKYLNISSVTNSTGTIRISGCPLSGENCSISGTSDKPTKLLELIMNDVNGRFTLNNTNIKTIDISATQNEDAEFEINGDTELRSLSLTGFKSIVIKGCPRLEKLIISEHPGTDVCEKIIIEIPEYNPIDGSTITGLTNFNDDISGRFDFTKYSKLKTLGLSGCKTVEVIKIPNHTVEIETFKENSNLEFIDTIGFYSCIMLTKDSTFYKCPRYNMKQSWAVNPDGSSNGKNIKPNESNSIPRSLDGKGYSCTIRTKMCIKPLEENGIGCVSLANTFYKQNKDEGSKYPNKNTSYTNEWGQLVYNPGMTMDDAAWFINKVVEGQKLDDAYIKDDGTIVDTQRAEDERIYGEDCSKNIISLQGCFAQRGSITYRGTPGFTVPNLSKYENLNNIASMYLNTGVDFISSELLSLYDGNNDNTEGHKLTWNDFTRTDKIYSDALKHISYRISELTSNYTVYNPSDNSTPIYSGDGELDGHGGILRFNVVDLLCPREGELFTRIASINYFSINSEQWVDYSHLFEYCPNVQNINGFLNGIDLSRAKIDGILKTCKNLRSVSDSFNHSGNIDELDSVDLYDFFNWADINSEENLFGITKLFSTENSISKDMPGFAIKKHITQENFAKIIGTLHKYTNIEKLSNIFSYCTIKNYSNYEIKLSGDLDNVKNLNFLFYNCKSENGNPLKIRRSFFEHLKNVTTLVNTFNGVVFDHMPSYDFFCKRKPKTENVYVKVEGVIPQNPNAVLHTYEYTTDQTDLYGCFMNAKFYNCKTWFDLYDNFGDINNPDYKNVSLKQPKDHIKDINNTDVFDNVDTYYKYSGGNYIEYKIKEPYAYTDILNNITNYVDSITISGETINNHNIFGAQDSDFSNYATSGFGLPYYDATGYNHLNIYPTYCCLPPDILYGCYYTCNLQNVFADTNIVGVLPQHLLGDNRYGSILNNIFRNVNILPNLVYHCDNRTSEYSQEYINILNGNLGDKSYLISEGGIPVDNDTINPQGETNVYTLLGSSNADAIVLFRDSNGELKRRYHIDNEHTATANGDYSKSQFAYVPQGFTKNKILDNAFTFRYNLPRQTDLSSQQIMYETGIQWTAGNYSNEHNPESHPEKWPYYIQYFFTMDESVSWSDVTSMTSPFILDEMDVDYKTGEVRIFSTVDGNYKNKWWWRPENVGIGRWQDVTGGKFNVFLDICGTRDKRTGLLKDCGAMISKSIDANNTSIGLDMFVSGPLVVFLNGRVFDTALDAIRLTRLNGSSIINYSMGFGRNIIFPRLGTIPYSDISMIPKVLLSFPTTSDMVRFYSYMFPTDSLSRYDLIYNISNSIDSSTPKFIVI